MRKTAWAAAVLLVLSLVVLVTWLYERGEVAPARPRLAKPPDFSLSGGRGLLLEVFAPTGGRLWRLRLTSATMATGSVLGGMGVRAAYTGGGSPASLVADRVDYQIDQARLRFRGSVHLSGPGFDLTCPELVFDDRARAFLVGGGYVLTRGETVMRGERLWVSKDFGVVRAMGAVRMRSSSVRGGME